MGVARSDSRLGAKWFYEFRSVHMHPCCTVLGVQKQNSGLVARSDVTTGRTSSSSSHLKASLSALQRRELDGAQAVELVDDLAVAMHSCAREREGLSMVCYDGPQAHTQSYWHAPAKSTAVCLWRFCAWMSAPCLINSVQQSAYPFFAASMSGVFPADWSVAPSNAALCS